MRQIIFLNKYNDLEPLHDCVTSTFELSKSKLNIQIEADGLSAYWRKKNISKLNITFLLNENFLDEDFIPPVRQINLGGHSKKSTIKYYTLKNFIKYVSVKQIKLRFYSVYFNINQCLLLFETENPYEIIEREVDIELLVDEIIIEGE